MHCFIKKIKNVLSADLRSLAVVRIAFASLIIIDLLIRSYDLNNHYTDAGVLPVSGFYKLHWHKFFFSLHALSGSYYFELLLFVVALFFAFSLLLGYKTKLCTIVSWFLLISLQTRNPLVLNAGDVLLRCLMFWAIFIPWGEKFSLDSYFHKSNLHKANKVFSIGILAFILQIVFMYVSTAILKTGPEWRIDYTAIYYALSIGHFSYFLGPYIYQFPVLMKILTFTIFWLELVGIFLFFVPYKNSFFKIIGLILFVSFQLGLLLSMRIGIFPLVNIAALLVFIPGLVWEKFPNFEQRIRKFFGRIYTNYFYKFYNFNKKEISISSKYNYIIVVPLLVAVFLWNINNLNMSAYPKELNFFTRTVRLDQKWNMFAPKPYKSDGWFVVVGLLENGSLIDVFRGGKAVGWDSPEDRHSDYPTYRWRKFMRNIYSKKYEVNRQYYARYLCNKWNKDETNQKLKDLDIYYAMEWTLPNYKTRNVEVKKLLNYRCYN